MKRLSKTPKISASRLNKDEEGFSQIKQIGVNEDASPKSQKHSETKKKNPLKKKKKSEKNLLLKKINSRKLLI